MSLISNHLAPLLLDSTSSPGITAPTSNGQVVNDIIAGVAVLMVIFTFIWNEIRAKKERRLRDEQAAEARAAADAAKTARAEEASRRDEEIEKLRKEADRRDEEISELRLESKRRDEELDLLRQQVADVRRAEEQQAKKKAAQVKVTLTNAGTTLRGIDLPVPPDHLWAARVENSSERTIRSVRAGIRPPGAQQAYYDAGGHTSPNPIGCPTTMRLIEHNKLESLPPGAQTIMVFPMSKVGQPDPDVVVRFIDDDEFEWQHGPKHSTRRVELSDWMQ